MKKTKQGRKKLAPAEEKHLSHVLAAASGYMMSSGRSEDPPPNPTPGG